MKPNEQIIHDVFAEIVNQHDIEKWEKFFSPDYVAHGAPFLGMGFIRDTSEQNHKVTFVIPDSPADGKLQVGDELIWVDDGDQRAKTFEAIEKALGGKQYIVGMKRGEESLEVSFTKDLVQGYDTPCKQAKAEMKEFMEVQFPDLTARIILTVADGDMVVALIEYRGNHTKYERETLWREAYITRFSEGKIVEGWPIIDESSYMRHLGFRVVRPEG